MNHIVYIALGSNLGDRFKNLRQAIAHLKSFLKDVKTSVVIETEALLLPNSPKEWDLPYLNMVIYGQTHLTPIALLEQLKKIELQLGRSQQHSRWSPRTIDLDILLYDNLNIDTHELIIPHAELKNRNFLLHLIALLTPHLKYPGSDYSFEDLSNDKLKNVDEPFYKTFTLYPQLVGIVNITPDSFSDGNYYYNLEAAVKHCHKLINEGASILDLGAQSTRPGASLITIEEEWNRLCPVLKQLDLKKFAISVDTFNDEIIERLLKQFHISWINDVSGKLKPSTLQIIASSGCKLCTMHALTIPPIPGQFLKNSFEYLNNWFEKQLEYLTKIGFDLKNIILDPGIGFGKSSYQTGILINKMEQFRRFGCEILVGHSRKSYLNLLGKRSANERDIETLAASQILKNKIDYLRVHNVSIHQRFLTTQHWIENCNEN